MYPRKSYTVDEAQNQLERYCVYQERCHKEVRQKLKDMNMIPEAQDKIIVHLLTHNFLNEERYAQAFVRGKFRIKKWGRKRLRIELQQRDISQTIIKKALQEIDDQEYLHSFNDLAKKRNDALVEPNRFKRRKKLADYLLYRGWESHLVYDKVRELIP